MAVTFYDLSSAAGLKKLDEYLLSRSYISGYQASKDDITVHAALSKPPSSDNVNVSRWYNHIEALLRISGVSGEGSGVTVKGLSPVGDAVATPPAADRKALVAEDDDDDDVDLFGEETEEEKKASEERAAALKASGKKKESGKSSVLLDIKPWDDETDMKKLEEAVRSVQMEGLFWGASKLVPVGYGIKKLQVMMTIVDDLVSVDTLIEERLTVEPINEYVQSCDIVAFNKICKFILHAFAGPSSNLRFNLSACLLVFILIYCHVQPPACIATRVVFGICCYWSQHTCACARACVGTPTLSRIREITLLHHQKYITRRQIGAQMNESDCSFYFIPTFIDNIVNSTFLRITSLMGTSVFAEFSWLILWPSSGDFATSFLCYLSCYVS